MPSCCVVLNCIYKYTRTENISFHKFPHQQNLLNKWIKFTGRGDNWFPSRWSSICSNHFVSTDFRTHKSRNSLRTGAIPTVFPGTIKDGNLNFSIIKNNEQNHQQSSFDNFNETTNNDNISFILPLESNFNKTKQNYIEDENICNISTQHNVNQLLNPKGLGKCLKLMVKEPTKLNNENKVFVRTVQNLVSINKSGKDHSSVLANVSSKISKVLSTEKNDDSQEKCILNSVVTAEIVCRLCGQSSIPILQSPSINSEVFEMIQKCFPSLQVKHDENVSKEICKQCFSNLKKFSNFTDIVIKRNAASENANRIEILKRQTKIFNSEKSSTNINIKQEPSPNPGIVKQEIISDICPAPSSEVSVNSSNNNEEICTTQQNDESIDQKSSHILHLPIINARQAVNNCDVMEIISLDDAFIELIDDDNQVENNQNQSDLNNRISEAKIERPDELLIHNTFNLSVYNLCEEHNYTMLNDEIDDHYKTEICDKENLNQDTKLNTISLLPKLDLVVPKKSEIVVLNENILKPAPSTYKLYTCNDCNLPFVFEVHLNEHRRINHPDTIHFCIKCNLKFKLFIDLLKHRKSCCKKVKIQKKISNLSTCTNCAKIFVSKLSLNNHQKYICEFRQKERTFYCKYCQIKLNKWIKLRQHEKKCHFKDVKKLNEKETKEIFDSRPKVIQNIQTVNPSNLLQSSTNSSKFHLIPHHQLNAKIYTCKICFRAYKIKQNLIRHSLTHRLQENLILNSNVSKTNLKEISSLDSELLKNDFHICLDCGKKYKSLQGLQEHSSKYHVEIKPEFPCYVCKKIFNGLRNLKQHMQQHNNIRRKCPMCDKTFKHSSGLNQHKRAFHLKLKPHECLVCNRKFFLKSDMKRCKHSNRKLRHLQGYLSDDDFDED